MIILKVNYNYRYCKINDFYHLGQILEGKKDFIMKMTLVIVTAASVPL